MRIYKSGAQWVFSAPSHNTLPAFQNLNGSQIWPCLQYSLIKTFDAKNHEYPFFRPSRFFKNSYPERIDNGIFRLNIWDWGFLRPLGIGWYELKEPQKWRWGRIEATFLRGQSRPRLWENQISSTRNLRLNN